jgi:hypothetical protein
MVPTEIWNRKLDKLSAARENNHHMDLLNSSGVTKNLDEVLSNLILNSKSQV